VATVRIPRRFNGPPGSGHGGYSCGVFSALVDEPTVVELRAPPPLDVSMTVVEIDEGVEIHDGETLVARSRRARVPEITPPTTVQLEDAVRAVDGYVGFIRHPFPTCFVCGHERPHDDGLAIYPGRVDDAGVVASPWVPARDLTGDDGGVAPAFVWAALDCPSAYGFLEWAEREGVEGAHDTAVLASMSVRQEAIVPIGEELVVLGWGTAADGRKRLAGSAVQTNDGAVLAVAETLWIRLRRPPV
jgi:hypothetical protein